jgi:two-component system chemotaxis response regulator CheB
VPDESVSVVALVCSAGGLDALTHVLAPLDPDFPAAIIALQHSRPDRRGLLAPILQRRCRLPVRDAKDGDVLVPGTVLVVPSGRHALATKGGALALISSDGPPPYRPSADLLLATLAVTAGNRAVAVVLSGEGSDGATGATAVHEFGGVVIAADKESSAHYGMPAAAISRDDVVDHVRPVDEIPALLNSLLGHAVPPQAGGPVVAS